MKVSLFFIVLSFILIHLSGCTKASSEVNYKFIKATQGKDVAKHGDTIISKAEMEKGLKSDIYKLEKQIYDLKFAKIKALLLEKVIAKQPNLEGMSVDQYIEKNITDKIKVSSQEVESFIKEKNIPEQHINDQVKTKIKEHLKAKRSQTALDKWLADKLGEKPVELYIDKPEAPTFKVKTEGAPFFGPENAKVTLVEFSDFQCPFCAKGAELVTKLKKKYKGKIKVVFKHFPLPFHKQAEKAAVASLCIHEQKPEFFWKMHDQMFADQTKLAEKELIATAKNLGADDKKFTDCLKKMTYLPRVKADFRHGKELGIDSTPTFFVNGKIVNGAQPIEVFSEMIDSELAR